MSSDPRALVQRLWDFCDVLRDDGLSYGDYLEQITYLLFLKMADEQFELLGQERVVPEGLDWPSLLGRSGADLEVHYNEILTKLGSGEDMLGVVFRKARNKVQNPAKLELLIKDFIDESPKCPTICHFGEKDKGIPMDDVRRIEAAHPEVKVFVYDADHGFNSDRRNNYDKASAELALKRTLELFEGA